MPARPVAPHRHRVGRAATDVGHEPDRAASGLAAHVAGLRFLLDQAPSGFVVAEAPSGRIVMFNAEAERILGHTIIAAESWCNGSSDGTIRLDGSRVDAADHPLARALTGEHVRDETVRCRRGDGVTVQLCVSASPLRSNAGHVIGASAAFVDVTERCLLEARARARLASVAAARVHEANDHAGELDRVHEALRAIAAGIEEKVRQRTAELAYQAQHDFLTGLPNRVSFEERLERAVVSAARYRRRLALLFLDLDGFKAVNDAFGHEAGDAILQEAAQRLRACLRRSDTLARFGGDEFTVLVSEIQAVGDAREVAQALLHALLEPFEVHGNRVALTASIGLSIYPDDAQDAAQLKRHADAAMYRVKSGGRNGFCCYEAREPCALFASAV